MGAEFSVTSGGGRDVFSYPGRVGLVELIQHNHGGAAVVKHKSPEVRGGAGQWMGGYNEGSRPVEAIHQCCVNVVVTLALGGDQESEGSVRWENIHAAVLLSVSW